MFICLVETKENPATQALKDKLIGISYTIVGQIPGVQCVPTIVAVDSAGVIRKEWRGDNLGAINSEDIIAAAAENPAPVVVTTYKRLSKGDFVKGIAGVIGEANFGTAWDDKRIQLYLICLDDFGRNDIETNALLTRFIAVSCMTSGQRSGILNQWPTI